MREEQCIFCKIANGDIPSATIYEDGDFRVIMDLNPASEGHCLILPKDHFKDIFELDEETGKKLFVLAAKVAKALKKTLPLAGLNLVQNNGEAAGQTVFHFHLHLIPRYEGDTVSVGWIPQQSDPDVLKKLSEEIGNAM